MLRHLERLIVLVGVLIGVIRRALTRIDFVSYSVGIPVIVVVLLSRAPAHCFSPPGSGAGFTRRDVP